MPLVGNPADWSATTKQGAVRDAFNGSLLHPHVAKACGVCDGVWRELVPSLGVAPLVFRSRVDGQMVDLPRGKERSRRLRNYVYEVAAHAADIDGWTAGEPSEPIVADPEPEPVPETRKAPAALSEAHTRFLAEVRRLRDFAKDREIDHISYRPVKDGARMISAGIPVEACLHAMTMHWDDADRRQAGIQPYDPATDFPGGVAAYMDALVQARVLMYLYGPAGMGKSYWAQTLADRMFGSDERFGFTPMTEGATVSWLLGRVDAQGFKPTKLLDVWENGGVYLFDEADAADPNMLLVMNGPLANDRLDNPVDQRTYRKHDDTILVFAGNTDGTGADAQYNARNPFDFSTFDRIRMGRVYVAYDADVEMAVMLANV
jgi:hypothetical protein